MRALAIPFALAIIATILWEAFETIILPRRVQRRLRLTRIFYTSTWRPWKFFARQFRDKKWRETLLSMYGPASLLLLFAVWAVMLVFGYGLLHWAIGSQLQLANGMPVDGFWTDIYYSGTTFFTLGLGEVTPKSGFARMITVVQAGNGMAYFAVVISYLPTLYNSFSTREINISLLDARAGSPATAGELLRRHSLYGDLSQLNELLKDWEIWSAGLMESHISYPVLCYFRSQHANQSWIAALTSILDTCAVVMTGLDGVSPWQARLTFAMCRHALVDIAQIFHRAPLPMVADRLPPEAFNKMREELKVANIVVGTSPDACSRLKEFRDMYEPYAYALSEMLLMPLPPWSKPEGSKDNWTTSAWKLVH